MSAVTILEAKGKLREIMNMTKGQNKPGWRIQLEQRIDSLRRRLSFIDHHHNLFDISHVFTRKILKINNLTKPIHTTT